MAILAGLGVNGVGAGDGKSMSWRDVTAECEWYDEGGEGALFYHSPCGREIRVQDTNGFRLTKISGPLQPHVAFIVEKQE